MKRMSKRIIVFALAVILSVSGWPIPDWVMTSKAETIESADASVEFETTFDEATSSKINETTDSELTDTSGLNDVTNSETNDISDFESDGTLSGDSTEIVEQGTCGDNLTWVITGDGILTISGTGNMYDYKRYDDAGVNPPWSYYDYDKVIIEEGVTSIGDTAFQVYGRFDSSIIEVKIAESVKSIGEYAFANCDELKSVTIPKNVTLIDEGAFANCYLLENVNVMTKRLDVRASAFESCSLKEFPLSQDMEIGYIGNGAFEGCSFTNVILPDSLGQIDQNVFAYCRNLISISIPDSVKAIQSSAFLGCTRLVDIKLPNGISEINASVFAGCSSLKNITIPDSVTLIRNSAFSGCSSLESITLPSGVTSIQDGAFHSCISLKKIVIPESTTTIGSSFFKCSNLTNVYIYRNLTNIGNNAFNECDNLATIYYEGSEDEWSAIDIGDFNEPLREANIIYNSDMSNEVSRYNGNISVRTFTDWDEEYQIASFQDSISYHVDEETDMSFLDDLDYLLGQKVLVVEDTKDVGLLRGIYGVECIKGCITDWDTESVTIDETKYPAAKDFSNKDTIGPLSQMAVCYLHEGVVVAVIFAEEKSGILEDWDGNSNEITIDENTYRVETDDLSFLQSIQNWIGKTIKYVLLDDIVIQINLSDYNTTYTGKLETYDEQTGALKFTDGELYYAADDLEGSPSNFIGKWAVYTIKTSQNEGIEIVKISPVTTELKVTLSVTNKDIHYKDGKLGFDGENFEERSDFEIPYQLVVESQTNAGTKVIPDLQKEAEYDITINDLNIETPYGFNFGWILKEGSIQPIVKETVLHVGDKLIAEGFIRPGLGYSPELLENTYTIKSVLETTAGEYSSEDTFTVTENSDNASNDTLKASSAQALETISDKIAINSMPEFFDQDTNKSICNALLSIALLTKADEKDFDEVLTEEIFNKVFENWKLETGTNSYDVPVRMAINTVKYGELIFEYTLHINTYSVNGTNFGIFGNIDYEIVGGKGMEEVQQNMPDKMRGSNVGIISRCDGKAFCDAAYSLAESEIKKAYNKFWGDEANKVADAIFGTTVKSILKAMNKSFSDVMFDIITYPTTSMTALCPVDIYVYNEAGEVCAAIVDNKVEKTSDDISLEVVGDTKVVTMWSRAYDLKLVSNGTGNMDIMIAEYAGMNRELCANKFYNIPLGENIEYSMNMPTEFLMDNYSLVDNEFKEIHPDQTILALEKVNSGDSEEHRHLYGEPEFNWSEDRKGCTAVFTCNIEDDVQRIECKITTEKEIPTCIESGKNIYIATAEFNDYEYTDTKEEEIPAAGHHYEYMDDGDGTHMKTCRDCAASESEPHTYEEGICKYCRAEEPEEHSHTYGIPEFEWSDDYTNCTAFFTCKDEDDTQRIKCEVSSKMTDPTCMEDGETVYTATVSFGGEEYTDTKKEVIPAIGHTYEYQDNGDGTHAKTCTVCDASSESEPHTYEKGICKYCKAGELKEHSHDYGEPKFKWSKNYENCTAVFTCKDGDDEQRIKCEMTSKTTDSTCTKDGKIVYTATVSFGGEEYTDTKEEKIKSTGHTYEYQNNGDGTHKKVCAYCGKSVTEPHNYQKGICKQCGAEEPSSNHYYDFGKGIKRFFEKVVIPFWENLFQFF